MTGDSGDEMVDPLTTAAAAKAIGTAGATEGAKQTGRLLSRVLGPSADEIGEALRRYTSFRVGNVAKIAEKAEAKGAGQREGQVPPRVAHRLLDEGSYCDDELMAEYLGGVLAASSTPGGRDDRAVVWSDMVTGLSSLQVRAHFLLYREWAARLHGRTDLNLGMDAGRRQCEMHVDLMEFLNALLAGHDVNPGEALSHAMVGLVRAGLIGPTYAFGGRESLGGHGSAASSPYPHLVLAGISLVGIELYGWAQGESGMDGSAFVVRAKPFAEREIPRLRQIALPLLSAAPAPGDASPSGDAS